MLRDCAAAAVDRYLLLAGRSAENPPHAAAAADSWGTETDNSTLPEHQLLYYAQKVDLQRINVKWRAWL